MTRAAKPRFSLGCKDGDTIKLPKSHGMTETVHVFDERSIAAVEAAMATGRPLLVRGEPGTGKSQLARAVAVQLKRALVVHVVDGRTETRDLHWSVDTVRRLAEAQVMAALHGTDAMKVSEHIALSKFVQPGPLWWAFDWASAAAQGDRAGCSATPEDDALGRDNGVVLLVDEIDKADVSVPNGLLDALGHGRFQTPDGKVVSVDEARPPIVVITTNEERALPDAFLRRCLVLQFEMPTDAKALEALLLARGVAHFKGASKVVLQRAAELLIHDRAELRDRDLSPPGVAEYIDLLSVVTKQYDDEAQQLELLDRVKDFALQKHPRELDP